MGNKTLQKLADDYAAGTITRYEYRKRRQTLIDNVTGYHASDAKRRSIDIETSSASREYRRYKLILLAALVAAIVVAVMYTSNDRRKTRSETGYYQTLSNETKST